MLTIARKLLTTTIEDVPEADFDPEALSKLTGRPVQGYSGTLDKPWGEDEDEDNGMSPTMLKFMASGFTSYSDFINSQ